MRLGQVVGTTVATIKDPRLEGKKILLIKPVDRSGRAQGQPRLALDAIGAGLGEHIYYVGGKEAAFAWYPEPVPCDCCIVGILDPYNFRSLRPTTAPPEMETKLTGASGR